MEASAKDALVRLEHVSLVYEREVVGLDDVSLTIAPGERIAVLGANGSGKSTLAEVCAGLLAPDAGEVELMGLRVLSAGEADLDAYRVARRSLGLVFQNPDDQIVSGVVEEDVAFGPENLGVAPAEIEKRVERELARVAMSAYAQADPARLSGGQKQRVAIAGALAMEPALVVFDEPSSLLDVRGREAILRVMGRMQAAGTAMLHVTHFMDEALTADRVVVLDHGRIALEGSPEEVFAHAELIDGLGLELPFEARLERLLERGAAEKIAEPADPHYRTEPLGLVARELVYSYKDADGPRALDGVSFEVEAGAHCAVVGQTGSGKSTLMRLICDLDRPDAGTISTAGLPRGQVGYVMQHPERQLFAETVADDVAFGPRNLGLPTEEVEARVDAALAAVGLAHKAASSPFDLSGGQQRLAAIAGILAMEPRILVLDEPTAGLDPRGRSELRSLMERLNAAGTTLIEVTHSMEDAARADEVVVLDAGRVLMQGAPEEVFAAGNADALKACGLGLPRPLSYALALEDAGAPGLGSPLTIELLAERMLEKGVGHGA